MQHNKESGTISLLENTKEERSGENMEEKILGVLQAIQKDIGGMKTDITSIKTDITSMKTDIDIMKSDITDMKTDINNIKSTQQEHTQLLRALEHRTDVIKAEQENMKMSLARNKLSGGII